MLAETDSITTTDAPDAPESSERTCAGCRAQDARAALVRLAVSRESDSASASASPSTSSTQLVPDLRGRLGGRGVSVHASRRCLALAAHKGGFARSLSQAMSVDDGALAQAIEEQLLGRARGLLLGGIRARKIALGTEAVIRTVQTEKLELLVVAHDAAGRSVELAERVRAAGKPVAVLADKAFLGGLASRAELGVLAILDRGIARELGRVASLLGTLTGQTEGSGASPSKSEAEAE